MSRSAIKIYLYPSHRENTFGDRHIIEVDNMVRVYWNNHFRFLRMMLPVL